MNVQLESSRLLSLPKELRLQIWEACFSQLHGPLQIGWPSGPPWDLGLRQYHPALLRVCELIRHEALPLLYKSRPVILVLRYREGRAEVQRWIDLVASNDRIARELQYVTVQYFNIPHRSTSVVLDVKKWEMMNPEQWIHPITKEHLRMLNSIQELLAEARSNTRPLSITLQSVLDTMVAPLQDSRLLRCESLANTRLHGYTDFQLRFEVIRILYNSPNVAVAME